MPRSSADLIRCRPLLGTFVKVRASGVSQGILADAIDGAFAEIARVERLMSAHDPESELHALNRDAHRVAVRVSMETFAVLRLARELHHVSGGLFDVGVAPSLAAWGYLPAFDLSASRGSASSIELRPGQRVAFTQPIRIDLGGIAKGYAVDRAIEVLIDAGVPSGTVDAGGDLRVFGPQTHTVHVRDPRRPSALIAAVEVRDMAVATSATYFSRGRHRGRLVSPLVDPRTDRAETRPTSVSVVAPTCAIADALTKVVLLGGPATGQVLRCYRASALRMTARGAAIRTQVLDAA